MTAAMREHRARSRRRFVHSLLMVFVALSLETEFPLEEEGGGRRKGEERNKERCDEDSSTRPQA